MTSGGTGGKEQVPSEAVLAFGQGLERYRAGDAAGAHALFERAHRRAPSDPRFMSWYGLTLVLVERNFNLGVLLCDQALRIAGPEPELMLNQARAHLSMGQRERAVKAIARGLSASPLDESLKAAQEAMGWRRKPFVPCLGRSNPINQWFGRFRHRWFRRAHPSQSLSPMTLGLLPRDEPPQQQGS